MTLLATPSPAAWVECAADNLPTLLLDHAHCERKAAATAVALMHRYPEDGDLLETLSRLAREELRHFEQVLSHMRERGLAYGKLPPSRYARLLFGQVREEPAPRKLDTLLVGAFIEARSAERFACLAGRLDAGLNRFYGRLQVAEARHFEAYLRLAASAGPKPEITNRIKEIAEFEAELICTPDNHFRFHSGPPLGVG